MPSHQEPQGIHAFSQSRLAAVLGLVFVLVVGLGSLSVMVVRQIEGLGTSATDNVQWSLSQMDVELLALEVAVDDALARPVPLDELRLRFDIAFSRFRTLESGGVYTGLRGSKGFASAFATLETFMLETVQLIDSPDPTLKAALPKIHNDLEALIPAARRLGTIGVEIFATQADSARSEIKLTLIALGVLSLSLLTALVTLVVHLFNSNRRQRDTALAFARTASRLEAVIRSSLDSVITLDESGRITDFSPAAETTFGHSRAAMLGQNLSS